MRLSRFLPRFSLRTLVLLTLLAASGAALWRNWAPWVPEFRLAEHSDYSHWGAYYSPDGRILVLTFTDGAVEVVEAKTGKGIIWLPTAPMKSHSYRIAFSSDSRRLV